MNGSTMSPQRRQGDKDGGLAENDAANGDDGIHPSFGTMMSRRPKSI